MKRFTVKGVMDNDTVIMDFEEFWEAEKEAFDLADEGFRYVQVIDNSDDNVCVYIDDEVL